MKPKDQKCGCGDSKKPASIQINIPTTSCGCSSVPESTETISSKKEYIIGSVQTTAGRVPQIAPTLTLKDYLGAFKVRWGIKRDYYRVDPGLYAIGTPNERSDVFVTANYKLSFDLVRKNLDGMNAWLLVLDTKGVNVWCAAGKGTFGTEELLRRIQLTSLKRIVIHRRIILPQLSATGVAADLVKESSGFTVIYGPVRAADIPAFVQTGYKSSKEMRRAKFDLYDLLKLVPNDIIYNMRYLVPLLLVISLFSGISTHGYSIELAVSNVLPAAKIILIGYCAGIVLTPLLLPFLPVRSFSFKGFIVGGTLSALFFMNTSVGSGLMGNLAGFFFIAGFSSFLAMLFTRRVTFTSLAGVKKEMRTAIPVQIVSAVLAVIFYILHNFIA